MTDVEHDGDFILETFMADIKAMRAGVRKVRASRPAVEVSEDQMRRSRAYRQANTEKVRAYRREYYRTHKADIAARRRRRYHEDEEFRRKDRIRQAEYRARKKAERKENQ